jgi:hypothetical protein
MAKSKLLPYGLRPGHQNQFRRTITVGKKKYTLVFEPGVTQDLSPQEIAALKPEIDGGLIVPWGQREEDHHNRLRPLSQSKPELVESEEGTDIDESDEEELVMADAMLGDE